MNESRIDESKSPLLLTRRTVLSAMGLCALATTGYVLTRDDEIVYPDPILPGSRVIVIGAGVSGTAASEALLAAGYKVETIEARDRTAGRAHSVKMDGIYADLGASWLHDGNANYLRPRAEAEQIKLYPTDFNRGVIQYGGELVDIDARQYLHEFESMMIPLYLKMKARGVLGMSTPMPSYADVMGDHFPGAQGAFLKDLLTASEGAPLDTVAVMTQLSEAGLGGDDGRDPLPTNDAMVDKGMRNLIMTMMKKSKPTLGEPVEAIVRTETGVLVKTSKRVVDADAVVCTIPLAVLKSGNVRFEPDMSAEQKSAMDRIGVSKEFKTFLSYPDNPWQSKYHIVGTADSPYFDFFINLPEINGTFGVLALSAGRKQDAAETKTESELAGLLHEQVRAVMGASIPDPIGNLTSNFSKDPYAQGCWSHAKLDTKGNEQRILRRPIAGRILLAGEAISNRYSYVDGAWMDGERVAQLIIDSV